MTTLIRPDFQCSYELQGKGKTLVFLHAFPLNHSMWQAQIDEFSRDFQVFAPDARGFGETTGFVDEPAIETLASDLAELLDFLGIDDRIILCGLSMGGYTALAFARMFPSRLRALILCDTRADADSDEAKTARDEMMVFARENGARQVAQKMSTKLLGETTRREQLQIAEQVEEMASTNTGEALAKAISALRNRPDSTNFLSSIHVPTLVVGGEEDVVSPPDVMREMANQIPDARYVSIEGAGHLSNLEAPEKFNAVLKEFLDNLK